MYIVYILKSDDFDKSYVGITNDLERRLIEHNSGRHTYTRRYIPWCVIYTEEFTNRIKARDREKYLKSAAGRRFMKSLF